MIDSLSENTIPSILSPIKCDLNLIDNTLEKPRKHGHKKSHKRHKKHKKSSDCEQILATLAFQHGVLTCQYDTLVRIIEISIAANRRQLNDQLLEDGLTALGPRKVSSLPK